MTVKILIVDPDITFSDPLKRALEMLGDYQVHTFASGQPALEFLQREAHDLVIVDTTISDPPLKQMIDTLRHGQPWLYLLLSAADPDDSLRALAVNGIVSKPYFARGLIPTLREVEQSVHRRQQGQKAKPQTLPQTLQKDSSELPTASESAAVPAHKAPLPPIKPRTLPPSTEVNLRRAIADLSQKAGADDTIPEPELPDDSTLRDVVRARTQPIQTETRITPSAETSQAAPSSDVVPEAVPPSPPDQLPEMPPAPETPGGIDPASLIAAMTLEITGDDTIGIEQLSDAFEEQSETLPPESRPEFNPMDIWVHAEDLNAPTLIGGLTGLHPVSDQTGVEDQEEASFYDEIARTFSKLVGENPTEPIPPQPVQPIDEQTSVKRALSILGVESVDELKVDEGEEEESETVDPLAQMALYLVQITTESAARVSILSKDGRMTASSGGITDRDLQSCVQQVTESWANKVIMTGDAPAVFRYIELPSGTDYLMYSIPTVEGMFLTMLFPGDVPLRVIRKQAHTLREALAQVPENAESEAAKTLPSRPTDVRPPQGLHESMTGTLTPETTPESTAVMPEVSTPKVLEVPVPDTQTEIAETPDTPQRPNVPYQGYTLVWLPRQGALTSEQVDLLPVWVRTAAEARFWDIEGIEAQSSHVVVQLKIPEEITPAEARTILQDAISPQAQPNAASGALWSDVYYVAAGERTISPQEIANLLEFQREAQAP